LLRSLDVKARRAEFSEQIKQVINCNACFVKNRAKGTDAENLVIWDNNARRWVGAAQNDVAALLTLHFEADLLEDAYLIAP
jgi:hypothetical protein